MPRVLLLLSVCLVLGGCRLDVTGEATLGADGEGTVGWSFRPDAALLAELDRLGVDPTAELEAAAAAEGWTVERITDDRGLEVTVSRPVADAADVGEAFRSLTAGLSPADPALVIDVEVRQDAEGRTEVTGSAGFRPPAGVGVAFDGDAPGPSGRELEASVAEVVVPRLLIELPGRVSAHDGDRLEGRTVVWDLPVGASREVRADAVPAEWWRRALDLAARHAAVTGALAVVAALLLVWLIVRVSRRR